MTLPPILSNLPFLKLFKTEQAGKTANKNPAPSGKPDQAQDTVALSGVAPVTLKNDGEAKATAVETRDQLAEHNVSLGA